MQNVHAINIISYSCIWSMVSICMGLRVYIYLVSLAEHNLLFHQKGDTYIPVRASTMQLSVVSPVLCF